VVVRTVARRRVAVEPTSKFRTLADAVAATTAAAVWAFIVATSLAPGAAGYDENVMANDTDTRVVPSAVGESVGVPVGLGVGGNEGLMGLEEGPAEGVAMGLAVGFGVDLGCGLAVGGSDSVGGGVEQLAASLAKELGAQLSG
jgi:hypothetical protein